MQESLNLLRLAAGRRRFFGGAAAAAAGLLAASPMQALAASTAPAGITDVDILNFALNLEYLEAEFYWNAAFGRSLPESDTTGKGDHGKLIGGRKVQFKDMAIKQFAKEIAEDERDHVLFLRKALGKDAVAQPAIDLRNSFNAAAQAAGLGSSFDPFADDDSFLLGAFVFEDVGVTAYKGAAPLISDKGYLEAAAGILAVEAYHAGNIRTNLYLRGLFKPAQAISDLRDKADGAGDDDQGIGKPFTANIVPTDQNGIAFSRTPQQVLSIVYLGGSKKGGFFPNGLNGTIA